MFSQKFFRVFEKEGRHKIPPKKAAQTTSKAAFTPLK
jgi:hypothetical protein